LYLLALGVAVIGIIVYANQDYPLSSDTFFNGALGAVLVGALLFIVALPRVQSRVKNVSLVLLVMLSFIALGATYFTAGPSGPPMATTAPIQAEGQRLSPPILAVDMQMVSLPDAFFAEVLWAILAGAALFIVTLPRMRTKILSYISFEQGVKVFSYTGGFIVIFAIVVMGALFFAASVPLWRLGVAIVAAVIVGRFGWRFLLRYRGINGPALAMSPDGDRKVVR
jgi:hypothetical protein